MKKKTIDEWIITDKCKNELKNIGFRLVEEVVDYVEMLNRISGSSTFYIRLSSSCLVEVEQLVAAEIQSTFNEINRTSSTDEKFKPIE